jgi:hypothetical protein
MLNHLMPGTKAPLLALICVVVAGCTRDEKLEGSTFYERKIGPVLHATCVSSPTRSGCHVSQEGGNALGNLSLESYEDLSRRHDLLRDYGPYGVPGLLLKVVPPYRLALTKWDSTEPLLVTTDIAHQGQTQIDFTSATFTTLKTWIENGAAENNAPPGEPARELDPCSDRLGQDPLFDPNSAPVTGDFPAFRADAGPVLATSCAAGNCHGSPSNALYLTCGSTPEQVRWNYFAASDYVSVDVSASEILRRALAPAAGGSFHEGGTVFQARTEPAYLSLQSWATAKGGPSHVPADNPGFDFFASRVQPMLVKRGCMMLGCHSASMFHDYRLRGGSGGHFGLPATKRNYELSLEQLSLESPDPNASRMIRKNLPLEAGGLRHRGGPLFGFPRDPGNPDDPGCDLVAAETGPLDEQRPYCVISAWHALERSLRMASAVPLSAVVYVRRPAAATGDSPQDYASYAPGATVVQSALSVAADGALSVGAETNLSSACGLEPAVTDARRPQVSWDGTRIAFAARTSASEPLRIYVVTESGCAVDPEIDAAPVDDGGNAVPDNGQLIHNFDPAFAPDGRIVFASTRGNLVSIDGGPKHAPADPSKLNANLYVREPDGRIRQLTFLSNQEILPSFMRDGRVIMTAEKRAPSFYQLAGRRINLDGGDYHPLFAQRSSVNFTQATDIVELADKNLAMILSDKGAARSAGTLAIINRSIGVDQLSQNEADYPVDPGAIGRPTSPFYQRAMRLFDELATGKLGGTQGAYRNPSPLPDGRLLVSYSATTAVDNVGAPFAIHVVDPGTGTRSSLIEDAGSDLIWPAAVYAKANHGVFRSRHDEANGATEVVQGDPNAEVTILDAGVLSSLLFQNTRSPRPIPDGMPAIRVFQSLPPPNANPSEFMTTDEYGPQYAARSLLGSVNVFPDQSAAMRVRGGTPIVLEMYSALGGESPALHAQREEMQFYPGERARQSFPREFFDGLCGGCHGSISGEELDLAVDPDILTRASDVAARGQFDDLSEVGGFSPVGPDFP